MPYNKNLHSPHDRAVNDFSNSKEFEALKNRYWGVAAIRDFVPKWDTRENSKILNWESTREELEDARLMYFKRADLLARLSCSEGFLPPKLYVEAQPARLLFIAKLWLESALLPPPMLIVHENTLRKRDGFHRLAVSLLTESTTYPCWVARDIS